MTTLAKVEILDNHMSVLCTKDEELDLPLLYWVPKLHNYPYTQRYIAGSAICPKDWCDSDVDTEEI
jgi:hypothetical protein